MAKRKPEEPPAGSPAWMSTFSDLMNLLLCFFVLLFSMSSVDEQKYNELVASMQSTFSIFSGGATAIGEGILISNGVSQLNELDEYINSTGKVADNEEDSEEFGTGAKDDKEETAEELQQALDEKNLQANEEVAERIQESVDESLMTEQIEVSFTAQYIQLSLKGALLFDSGKAYIREESERVLDKVGVILERYATGTIEIEGHTDNVPIHNAQFDNNNVLSSARALSVFDYIVEHTSLDPAVIKHSGRGEYNPIADNSTEAGRSKNRRVEIKIYRTAE